LLTVSAPNIVSGSWNPGATVPALVTVLKTVPVLPKIPAGSTLTGDRSEPVKLMAPSVMVV
jgi:hypothetical protein